VTTERPLLQAPASMKPTHGQIVVHLSRFVDPTTSERQYSEAEMEFMMAMNEYKRSSGRMFPTWSEVLEVLQRLGYEKVTAGELR
jgi:hypothetical protein